MADGVKDSIIAPAPENAKTPPKETPKPEKGEYKLLEVRLDGTATIGMDDGRQFVATIPEGLATRKNAKVELKFDNEDKEGVPLNAEVSRLVPAS